MPSFQKNLNYICDETLAEAINFTENLDGTYAEFDLIIQLLPRLKFKNQNIAEKTAYNKKELLEFKTLILEKIDVHKKIWKYACRNV